MKWLGVFLLFVCCCAAEKVSVKTVNIPTGNAGTHPRIIGGTNTSIEKYPYIVQVLNLGTAVCGGSLITVRHVLSAAHCFFDDNNVPFDIRSFSIRAGSTRLGSGGSVHSVSAVITHELYNRPPVPNDNDIAVLLLATAVTLGPQVARASILMQGDEVPDNLTVVQLGWGTTHAEIHMPSVILQEIEIKTVSQRVCFAQYELYGEMIGYPGQFPITNNMICAGLLGIGGKDACQGDSGGPLAYEDGIVLGITSWGAGCADPRFPGVNAKVSAYTDWIIDTVTRYNASPPVGKISVILMLVSLVSTFILGSK